MNEADWVHIRKYKNILKFLTHYASFKELESFDELSMILEVILFFNLAICEFETSFSW